MDTFFDEYAESSAPLPLHTMVDGPPLSIDGEVDVCFVLTMSKHLLTDCPACLTALQHSAGCMPAATSLASAPQSMPVRMARHAVNLEFCTYCVLPVTAPEQSHGAACRLVQAVAMLAAAAAGQPGKCFSAVNPPEGANEGKVLWKQVVEKAGKTEDERLKLPDYFKVGCVL